MTRPCKHPVIAKGIGSGSPAGKSSSWEGMLLPVCVGPVGLQLEVPAHTLTLPGIVHAIYSVPAHDAAVELKAMLEMTFKTDALVFGACVVAQDPRSGGQSFLVWESLGGVCSQTL